ncbi:MAG: DUF7064 domain-containing protein [Gammaproteobacteria bacterium]
MAHYLLEASDEFNHEPGPEPNFNESVYVNAFDPERRCGGWLRLGNRVNEGHAEAQVCLYLPDGRIACQFQRPELHDNNAFAAGGLSYEVVEPLSEVAMRYEGELMLLDDPSVLREPRRMFETAPRVPASVRVGLAGTSPVYGGEPASDEQETMYGRDFSFGHLFQHGAGRMEIRLGDEALVFDGCGWRDHSWGPRYWTNIWFYRLFIANFGPRHGLCLLKITGRDGVTRRHGVLQVDGDYEEITDLDVMTDWSPAKDPVRVRLGVRTARRGVSLRGEVLTLAPLRNRRRVGDELLACRIAEGLTAWDWDGRRGVGMTEYIEFLEDGEPVGYPL